MASYRNVNDWLQANNIHHTDTTSNAFFQDDKAKHKALFDTKPWNKDPHYVKRCYISALAVLKLIMHAQTGRQRQGGSATSQREEWIEVMGQMQGHVQDNCVILTDAFGIPVPATAVECSLDDAATNYLVQYSELTEKVGKPSKVFGWYHTHPGYTSFLSGTDVNTQRLQQMMGGPVVALVLDPVRTLASGKIELKAFRTYAENYTPSTPEDIQARQAIDRECEKVQLGEADPSAGLIGDGISAVNNKKRDVAHFAKSYYEVPITIFRSEKDAELLGHLWGRFWGKTLSSSPHIDNRDFVNREVGAIATHLSAGHFALPSAQLLAQQNKGVGSGTATKAPTNANTAGVNDNMSSSAATADGSRKQRGRNGTGNDTYTSNFGDVLPLSRNLGLDALQGLLTSHAKRTVFSQ